MATLIARIPSARRTPPLTTAIVLSILAGWCFSAFSIQQSIVAAQHSRKLLELGAINGALLGSEGWWRLVISQFLHVRFLHMLFNALCVGLLARALELRYSWLWLAVTYFVGGAIGQLASVIAYPELVSSGASQALMALCAVSLLIPLAGRWKAVAAGVLVIQAGLDVYVAQTIKAGHLWGFLAGIVLAVLFNILLRRRRSSAVCNVA